MHGWFYLNEMHANHANLTMRYLAIRWSDLKIGHTVVTILEPQDHFYDMQ